MDPSWFNFTSGSSDFYQVTPPGWNPFQDGRQSSFFFFFTSTHGPGSIRKIDYNEHSILLFVISIGRRCSLGIRPNYIHAISSLEVIKSRVIL